MIDVDTTISRLKHRTAFLERAKQQFPDLKQEGHCLQSASVNPIAEYVDTWERTWPYAIPYVLFEGEPIFCVPMLFGLATDEGYPVDWQKDMRAANVNPAIITRTENLIQTNGYKYHYDTTESKEFWADVWYGARAFGY